MSINFSTKTVKFPGALKAYTEGQLQAIAKIAGDIIDADVIVSQEKIGYKVEISLKTRLHSLYGQSNERILKQAVRSTLDAIKTQAKKNKEKIKEEKKRVGVKSFSRDVLEAGIADDRGEQKREGRKPILVSENYSRKPITVEEAIFFLEESLEEAYMFINAETNRPATVFRNTRGSISLIEPEI